MRLIHLAIFASPLIGVALACSSDVTTTPAATSGPATAASSGAGGAGAAGGGSSSVGGMAGVGGMAQGGMAQGGMAQGGMAQGGAGGGMGQGGANGTNCENCADNAENGACATEFALCVGQCENWWDCYTDTCIGNNDFSSQCFATCDQMANNAAMALKTCLCNECSNACTPFCM